jgi:hypothetical protein
VWLLNLKVDTIGSRFGGIPAGLPSFAWPAFSWESAKFLLIPTVTLACWAPSSRCCAPRCGRHDRRSRTTPTRN